MIENDSCSINQGDKCVGNCIICSVHPMPYERSEYLHNRSNESCPHGYAYDIGECPYCDDSYPEECEKCTRYPSRYKHSKRAS